MPWFNTLTCDTCGKETSVSDNCVWNSVEVLTSNCKNYFKKDNCPGDFYESATYYYDLDKKRVTTIKLFPNTRTKKN